MGCDIHFHSEVKIKGTWHHHSEARFNRNYVVFAKMAGVRNGYGIDPICQPKGIPDDATLLTKMEIEKYNGDGHSHSWFNAEEIVVFHDWLRDENSKEFWAGVNNGWIYAHDNIPYFMGNHMDGFLKYPEDWKKHGIEDVRYVFFFDN